MEIERNKNLTLSIFFHLFLQISVFSIRKLPNGKFYTREENVDREVHVDV
ncbi:hypothetical protein SAMN05444955_10787 [Lihuaxuella thermophila]|uniref:Uncharacterized protein n=1 Tax=Lihuaxuella thermophila TaxID=1173111 RepID=A0A1H8EQB5_9BACL|nr:hypothetical protein SAMN05444955_10787 [Lihuaxuella thermophila]